MTNWSNEEADVSFGHPKLVNIQTPLSEIQPQKLQSDHHGTPRLSSHKLFFAQIDILA